MSRFYGSLCIYSVKENQHATRLGGQRSFSSKAVVQTHTQWTECSTWTTKVVSNNNRQTCGRKVSRMDTVTGVGR